MASAVVDIPAQAAESDPGIAEEAGTEQVLADGGSTDEGAAGSPGVPVDFMERIRTDGDFAAQQVTQHQSRADKATAELEKIPPQFKQWVQTGNADTVLSVVDDYLKMTQDPEMAALMERYKQTGKVEGVKDYIEDTEDDPNTALLARINALEQQLVQTQTQTQFTAEQGRLQGVFEQALGEFPLQPEEKEAALSAAQSQLKEWSATPQGVQAIKQLDATSARALFLRNFTTEQIMSFGKRADSLKNETRQGHATDGGASTNRSASPVVDQEGSIADIALRALTAAATNEGVDLSRGLPRSLS